jgi:NAD(P) transhydrogenase subunit alpha
MLRTIGRRCAVLTGVCLAACAAAASDAPAADVSGTNWNSLTVLVLATFVGLGVIGRVSRLLHTPLMSLTNAISAISVVGSILIAGSDYPIEIRALGAVALFASMTNIVSGFLITERMIRMFKERGESAKSVAAKSVAAQK